MLESKITMLSQVYHILVVKYLLRGGELCRSKLYDVRKAYLWQTALTELTIKSTCVIIAR